jgi:hypothetical protein
MHPALENGVAVESIYTKKFHIVSVVNFAALG